MVVVGIQTYPVAFEIILNFLLLFANGEIVQYLLWCLSLRLRDEEECEGGDGRDEHGEDPERPVLPERRHHRAEEPSHHEGHRPVEAG